MNVTHNPRTYVRRLVGPWGSSSLEKQREDGVLGDLITDSRSFYCIIKKLWVKMSVVNYDPIFLKFEENICEIEAPVDVCLDQDVDYTVCSLFMLDLNETQNLNTLVQDDGETFFNDNGTSLLRATTDVDPPSLIEVHSSIKATIGETFFFLYDEVTMLLCRGASSLSNARFVTYLLRVGAEVMLFAVDRGLQVTDRLRVKLCVTDEWRSAVLGEDETLYLKSGVYLGLLSREQRLLLCMPRLQSDTQVVGPKTTSVTKSDTDLLFVVSAPSFELKSSCRKCSQPFGFQRFRHHCRSCGGSFCSDHAIKRRSLPHFGIASHVRVCHYCAYLIDEEHARQMLRWRLMRVDCFLAGTLQSYAHHEVDSPLEKVSRVSRGTFELVRNTFGLGYPFRVLFDSVSLIRKHGLSGISGFLLRHDFVEAVEMLKRVSGYEKFPISLTELTTCIYYKLALERGVRGDDPDRESREHIAEGLLLNDKCAGKCTREDNSLSDKNLNEAIQIAPLALIAVYENNPVDLQRIASSQGWQTIFVQLESKPEQPAYALFARGAVEGEHHKTAVLSIRGTHTVEDIVTDIRTQPCSFPPSAACIAQAWEGVLRMEDIEVTSVSDEWQRLSSFSSSTRACGGIGRAAVWLLAQVGQSLLKLGQQGYDMIITGHSLGGAVAALLVLLIKTRMSCRGWAFGAPCCLDMQLSDALRSSVTTVVLRDDAVSRITPHSISDFMRSVLRSREEVRNCFQQDWADISQRIFGLWRPRRRKSPQIVSEVRRTDHILKQRCNISHPKCDTACVTDDSQSTEENDDFVVVETQQMLELWLPGTVVHLYSHRGQTKGCIVSRSFPPLRKLCVQGTMFEDHRAQNIFDALLEVKAVRSARSSAPIWATFGSSDCCNCCKNSFTWHSTVRVSSAANLRERHHCRSCGKLSCGPCSEKRVALPAFGIFTAVRVCDACFYTGNHAA